MELNNDLKKRLVTLKMDNERLSNTGKHSWISGAGAVRTWQATRHAAFWLKKITFGIPFENLREYIVVKVP